MLAGSAVVVPLVVARWRPDPFALPKLVVLWVVLIICTLVIAAAVFGFLGGGVRFDYRRMIDLPLTMFVALNVAATIFSVDPSQSLIGERNQYQGLLATLLYVGFFMLARLCVRTAAQLRGLFSSIAVGATAVAVYGIAQRQGVDPVWEGAIEVRRVFSSIGQPNALAAYLIVAIPITFVLSRGARRTTAVVAIGAAATITIASLMTESRGGFLGLAATLPLLVVIWRRWTPATAAKSVLAAGVLVLALLPVLLSTPLKGLLADSWERFESISELTDDVSGSDHWDVWTVAVKVATDNPILGTGPETFPDVFSDHSYAALSEERAIYFDRFRVESAHNFLLAIVAGSGVPSLLSYLWFLAAVAFALVSRARSAPPSALLLRATAVALVGYIVTNVFITPEFTGTWLIWLLMGAALGVAEGDQTDEFEDPSLTRREIVIEGDI